MRSSGDSSPSEIGLPQTHGSIHVRPVQPADAEAVRQMCWPDRSEEQIKLLIERARHLADNQRGLGVVGVCDEVVCAFGLLTRWPRVAEISDLFVNNAYRSRGIGTMIIQHLTEAARTLNIDNLEIGVALSNPRALALYRRLGFIDGRIIQLELGNGPEPVLYLYKTLVAGS